MADDSGTGFLGFILGGVVVVLVIIGFIVYSGGNIGSGTKTVNINVPSAPSAPSK